MNNAKAFGNVLARIRKEQGFPSAHQFFKSIGGSKSLGVAFVSYWDMERGKKLPKSWRLKVVMAALGIEQRSPKAQELVRAYFRALSGSDELVQMLAAPAAAGADLPGRDLVEAIAHQAQARRTVTLTMAQWKLLAKDLATQIIQYILVDTTGWVTVRELSDATKFKPEAIRKAFKALAAGGLVDLSGDKARGLLTGKVINATMPLVPETAAINAALLANLQAWLARSEVVEEKHLSLRMTKANMDVYRQHLEKAMNLASVYSDPEANRQESAIYSINTKIYRFTRGD
jgi:hypothetical protein